LETTVVLTFCRDLVTVLSFVFPDFLPRDAHGGVELGVLGGDVVVSPILVREFASFSWYSSLGAFLPNSYYPHKNASTNFVI